jgi:hypothetical protein
MRLLGVAFVLAWLAPPLAVAQDAGTITFLEGSLRMIRDATVYQVAEGVRLRQGDILESSEMGFVQLEFMNGPIVVIGPLSRVYVFQHRARGNSGSGTAQGELVLLSGWLKALSGAHARPYRFASPLLTATTRDGTVVIHATDSECDVFIETGSAAIVDTSGGGNADKPASGNTRQFFSRHPGKVRTNSSGPSTVFVDAMPVAFRDDLPSRLAQFTGKPPEPKALHAVSYGEIQAWLTMPAQWRKGFVQRFELRLEDPQFRKQLEAHVAEYPEWGPALQPN